MNGRSSDPFWRWVAAGASVFVVLIALAFYLVPVVSLPDTGDLAPYDLASQRATIRGNALQAVGAIAVGVGLMLTARSVTLASRSVAVHREGQVGDRIAHAIDHLTSDQVAVRVAGVYSLGRIAENAPDERQLILEVLRTYVRHGTAKSVSNSQTDRDVSGRPDVEAALAVLNRWPFDD